MRRRQILSIALSVVATIWLANSMAFAAYTPPATIPTCNSFDVNGVPTYNGSTLCTDFFGVPNWANSPLPAGSITGFTITAFGSGYTVIPNVSITDANGTGATAIATIDLSGHVTAITVTNGGTGYIAPQVTIDPPTTPNGLTAAAQATIGGTLSGGIRKFVNGLPGLTSANANNIGQYIPLANPDTTTFPGSDYYVIGLKDHTEQMHSDLPVGGTKIRSYYQKNSGTTGATDQSTHYLGPLILATMNRPVRVLFQNELPLGSAGDLFIPTDTTYMGAGMGPNGTDFYTQNRATLHLHGGNTPWISDGTPHQWITPPNETGTSYQKGVSFANVPDMVTNPSVFPAPPSNTDGNQTFYWTNQQGERLMFYHDHAYGMTRLNVYAGEAAGYYLVDPAQETALQTATAPGTIITDPATGAIQTADLAHFVPLVIQDKTFVPPTNQLAATDPTWNSTLYGSEGSFWFPHVYMTNQDPQDPLNMNGYGRWDYGPWFFPPQGSLTAGPLDIPCTSSAFPGLTVKCPIIPNPSGTPESFMDTPVVNGTPYPVLHVAPAAYRFQILSAGNDRAFNLSWFIAADATGIPCDGTQAPGTACTEVNMLPAQTPAPATMPLCMDITNITNPALQTGLAMATLDAQGNPVNGTGLPGTQLNPCWPSTWPTTNSLISAGLSGIVPDPRYAGPAWIQIGTEGGLLPTPVVIPATPTTFETNPKSVTVGSVAIHGLFLGPAERADVIVDFSQFAGKTLILYNDGPAPVPGYDIRNDYFTGNADQTAVGGAPSTLPGYGPNTRTIMQVIVDVTNSPNTTTFQLPQLMAAFNTTANTTGQFKATQPTPIVPESTYNSAYNATYTNTFMKLQDNYITYLNFDGSLPLITVTSGGSDYTSVPAVGFIGGSCSTQPSAVATITGGAVTDITLTNPGVCSSIPSVTITGGGGIGAYAIVGAFLKKKAIQELFTLDYGRLNATLGTEQPLINFFTQTTIPLGYVDPPTEIFRDGETQFWRVTHNGVDTHLIHFHLFNVQVINRVGWDGTLRPPDYNELGWKDTVRMNPLEDIVVALKPLKQNLPFPMPDSVRMLDVTQPAGATNANNTPGFSNVDPFTNIPMPTVNQNTNFGWEYVWHCHILGHEENDMMRPMVFEVPPEAPTAVTAVFQLGAKLTWNNTAVSATSFTIQRATDPAFTVGLTEFNYTLNTLPPAMDGPIFPLGSTTFTDTTVLPATTYYYRVAATKTFPARQSPTWGAPGTAEAVQTENVNSAFVNADAPVNISGNIVITPLSLSFGDVAVNFISNPQAFTVTNQGLGNLSLTLNSITLGGLDLADFTVNTGSCGPIPFTLQPLQSCTFTASFAPITAGSNKTATISVGSTDPTVTLNLTGNGVTANGPVQRTIPTPVTLFNSMLLAFNAATGNTTLQAWDALLPANGTTSANVTVNSTGTVNFTGGYNPTYATRQSTLTGLRGTLTIRTGTFVVDGLSIQ
jgi:FtsP/CotA-like multicopper oxidase with cupredoxin domain